MEILKAIGFIAKNDQSYVRITPEGNQFVGTRMVGDASATMLGSWRRVADPQLSHGTPFSSACNELKTKGIRFKIRLLTTETSRELHEWD